MKWINRSLWIAGAVLIILSIGCTVKESRQRLTIWSRGTEIITERVKKPPKIVIEGLQFFVVWESLGGELRVFVGPRRDTRVLIEGGRAEELRDEKEEKRPPVKPKNFKFLKWVEI